MSRTSVLHIDFYSSIIINGIESGWVNWGQVDNYNSGFNHSTGEQHEAYVELYLDDPEYAVIPDSVRLADALLTDGKVMVNIPSIVKALNKIINGDIKINPNLRDLCKEAKAEWDGGMLDAIACDVIIQVAVFDEIVYG